MLETGSNAGTVQSRNLDPARGPRAGAKLGSKLFKTEWEDVREKQRRKFSIVNHDEYGDKGRKGTLPDDLIKPTNAKIPQLNLNGV